MRDFKDFMAEAMQKAAHPYHVGYSAHGQKKTRQDNPYKEGSEGAAQWAKGWEHASDGKPRVKFTNEEVEGVVEGSTGWHPSSTEKNPNFNNDLSGRRVSPPGKRLKSGDLDYNERTSQERLKAIMKFTKNMGVPAGPKGKLPEEVDLDEANENIPVDHAVRSVEKVLGRSSATRFALHLKPGTKKHTTWDKINNALSKQGVKPKHIASIATHVKPSKFAPKFSEEVDLDEMVKVGDKIISGGRNITAGVVKKIEDGHAIIHHAKTNTLHKVALDAITDKNIVREEVKEAHMLSFLSYLLDEEHLVEAIKRKLAAGTKVRHPVYGSGTVHMISSGGGSMVAKDSAIVKFGDQKKTVKVRDLSLKEEAEIDEEVEQVEESEDDDMAKSAYMQGLKHGREGSGNNMTGPKERLGKHFKHYNDGFLKGRNEKAKHLKSVGQGYGKKNEEVEQVEESEDDDISKTAYMYGLKHGREGVGNNMDRAKAEWGDNFKHYNAGFLKGRNEKAKHLKSVGQGYGKKNEEVELEEGRGAYDELAGRMGTSSPGYNKTPAGKARELKRRQEHLKSQMKSTQSLGGLTGPKSKLPEEAEVEESFAADFLAMAKQKHPTARLVTPEQKKKETEDLIKKREAERAKRPSQAPYVPKDSYPLGGYDPKSHRSYSE